MKQTFGGQNHIFEYALWMDPGGTEAEKRSTLDALISAKSDQQAVVTLRVQQNEEVQFQQNISNTIPTGVTASLKGNGGKENESRSLIPKPTKNVLAAYDNNLQEEIQQGVQGKDLDEESTAQFFLNVARQ